MKETHKLGITESSDFHCLLELLLPMYDEPGFAWLPELFSIIGFEKLLILAKYAGGETIKIPKVDEINEAMEALSWYYAIHIKKEKRIQDSPFKVRPLIRKIEEVYKDVGNN